MPEPMSEYAFLRTNDELSVERLRVEGRMPAWLQGTLLRNGPGQMRAGEQRFRHWFDGFAMLHAFTFAGGHVRYDAKFLQTAARASAEAEGRITYTDFATDPCRSLFARAMAMFNHRVTDNAKVSIGHFAERFLAMTETAIQVEFDPETLATVGVFQYEDESVGQMTTAHPHYADDYMYNVVTRFGRASEVRAYRIDQTMRRERLGAFGAAKPSYMHSFAMTPNYLVVTEFPFVVNPLSLLFWLRPFIENFAWEPRRGTPFTVLDRHTGAVVRRIEADPFFAFHHVNAVERDGELLVDAVAYPDADIITHYYLERLTSAELRLPHGRLTRYTVPLRGGRVRSEPLADACIELPHIDYARHNMDPAQRYVYGIGLQPERQHEFYNQLVKIDTRSGAVAAWHEPDCFPGEPVFVGAPGRSGEDDGVLLSVVLDARGARSFLLVLDATDLGEIARAVLPEPVMIGFHGTFVPGALVPGGSTPDADA
jgi:beta,beta-carotene 9',10'-dioxygenase